MIANAKGELNDEAVLMSRVPDGSVLGLELIKMSYLIPAREGEHGLHWSSFANSMNMHSLVRNDKDREKVKLSVYAFYWLAEGANIKSNSRKFRAIVFKSHNKKSSWINLLKAKEYKVKEHIYHFLMCFMDSG